MHRGTIFRMETMIFALSSSLLFILLRNKMEKQPFSGPIPILLGSRILPSHLFLWDPTQAQAIGQTLNVAFNWLIGPPVYHLSERRKRTNTRRKSRTGDDVNISTAEYRLNVYRVPLCTAVRSCKDLVLPSDRPSAISQSILPVNWSTVEAQIYLVFDRCLSVIWVDKANGKL